MPHLTRSDLPLTELQETTVEVMRAHHVRSGRWPRVSELATAFQVSRKTMRERLMAIAERGAAQKIARGLWVPADVAAEQESSST